MKAHRTATLEVFDAEKQEDGSVILSANNHRRHITSDEFKAHFKEGEPPEPKPKKIKEPTS